MKKHNSSQLNYYLNDKKLYKMMRVDLMRAIILGVFCSIFLIILVNYSFNYDHGLQGIPYFFGTLTGLSIVLYKPGRPALVNRNTFGFSKRLSEYEKKLEFVMLFLRKRSIVILLVLPYVFWLIYVISNYNLPIVENFEMTFSSLLLSFLTALIYGSLVQYFQIWWTLGKRRNVN